MKASIHEQKSNIPYSSKTKTIKPINIINTVNACEFDIRPRDSIIKTDVNSSMIITFGLNE